MRTLLRLLFPWKLKLPTQQINNSHDHLYALNGVIKNALICTYNHYHSTNALL